MKKIIVICCIVLLLSIIPTAAGVQLPKDSEPHNGIINRTIIRGVALFPRVTNGGKSLTFFAVRVHYRTITLEGVLSGIIRCRPVTIPNTVSGFIGKCYLMGTFHGPIDIFP
ncbi:MAG: hypothetical protein KKC68_02365 [Candidatus Thermoplasmatota archaeon]|nr:hypothetical protein [Candidatus Thermoplasmatota archaeon]MBU1940595.1 hypothetical protein [Candidatus Thermoplasmatota archaeon]